MLAKPLDFFRQSFATCVLLLSAFIFLLATPELLQGLLQPENLAPFDGGRWLQNACVVALRVSLLALPLPWLLLLWAGEWLQTRPFSRQELLKLIAGEYLRWWAGLSVSLALLTFLSHLWIFDSGSAHPWEAAVLLPFLSLLLSLLMLTPPEIIQGLKFPLLCLTLLVWGTWDLQPGAIPLGLLLLMSALLALFVYLGRLQLQPPRDSVFGQGELSTDTVSRSSRSSSGALRSVWPSLLLRFRLLSAHISPVYVRFALIFAGLLLLPYLSSEFSRQGDWLVLGGSVTEGLRLSAAQFLLLGLLAGVGLLLQIAPERLLRPYAEFLITRPVSTAMIYLSGWGLQVAMAALCFSLLLLSANSWWAPLMPEAFATGFNLPALWLLFGLLALGGEAFCLGLFCLGSISLLGFPVFGPAFVALFHSAGWPALCLWGCALACRLWSFASFRPDLLEPIQTPQKSLVRFGQKTLLPGGLMALVSTGAIYSQPLPRFLAFSPQRSSDQAASTWKLGLETLQAVYLKATPPNYAQEIQGLRDQPWEPERALDLAQAFLRRRTYPGETESYQPTSAASLQQARYWLAAGAGAKPEYQAALRAQLAEQEHQLGLALVEIERAIAIVPDTNYLMIRARLEREGLNYRAARATWQAIGARHAFLTERSLTERGHLAVEQGLPQQALKLYFQALSASNTIANKWSPNLAFPSLHMLLYRHPDLCAQLSSTQAQQLHTSFEYWRQQMGRLSVPCQTLTPRQVARLALERHQPEQALRTLQGDSERGSAWHILRARALVQQGQVAQARQALQAVGRYELNRQWMFMSFSEQARSFDTIWSDTNLNQRYYLHRLLLELEPARDSALYVLFYGYQPEQDWPLMARAFANQPAVLAELTELRQAARVLKQAFERHGAERLSQHSSWPQWVRMLAHFKTLPAGPDSAQVEQAARTLKQALGAP
jgi:hypothetical protein